MYISLYSLIYAYYVPLSNWCKSTVQVKLCNVKKCLN